LSPRGAGDGEGPPPRLCEMSPCLCGSQIRSLFIRHRVRPRVQKSCSFTVRFSSSIKIRVASADLKGMNRRREQRFEIDQAVTLTGLERSTPSTVGRLTNLSATGLAVVTGRGYPSGTALRIECGETQLFGTVVHCTAAGREFSLGIELEDAIYSGASRRRAHAVREPRRKVRAVGSGVR
jgi:hypothetical protein